MAIFETTADLCISGECRELPIIVDYTWHDKIPAKLEAGSGLELYPEVAAHVEIERMRVEISNGVYMDNTMLVACFFLDDQVSALAAEIALGQ